MHQQLIFLLCTVPTRTFFTSSGWHTFLETVASSICNHHQQSAISNHHGPPTSSMGTHHGLMRCRVQTSTRLLPKKHTKTRRVAIDYPSQFVSIYYASVYIYIYILWKVYQTKKMETANRSFSTQDPSWKIDHTTDTVCLLFNGCSYHKEMVDVSMWSTNSINSIELFHLYSTFTANHHPWHADSTGTNRRNLRVWHPLNLAFPQAGVNNGVTNRCWNPPSSHPFIYLNPLGARKFLGAINPYSGEVIRKLVPDILNIATARNHVSSFGAGHVISWNKGIRD